VAPLSQVDLVARILENPDWNKESEKGEDFERDAPDNLGFL